MNDAKQATPANAGTAPLNWKEVWYTNCPVVSAASFSLDRVMESVTSNSNSN